MDVQQMRHEVQRLAQMIANWDDLQSVTPIERDLALEKLRALYEAVRFEVEPLAEEFETVDVPAGFELEESSETDKDTVTAASEPQSQPNERLRVEPAMTDTEPTPHPMLQTLFDLEPADTERHRRNRRVIMSLYDTTESIENGKLTIDNQVVSVETEDKVEPAMPEQTEQAIPEPDEPMQVMDNGQWTMDNENPLEEEEFEEPEIELEIERGSEPETTDDDSTVTAVGEPQSQSDEGLRVEPAMTQQAEEEPEIPDAEDDDKDEEVVFEEVTLEELPALRDLIGINDRFLIVRDLFAGNAAAYEATISHLDTFETLDDCMIYIAEHFAWNSRSDGAKALMEHLEAKFA